MLTIIETRSEQIKTTEPMHWIIPNRRCFSKETTHAAKKFGMRAHMICRWFSFASLLRENLLIWFNFIRNIPLILLRHRKRKEKRWPCFDTCTPLLSFKGLEFEDQISIDKLIIYFLVYQWYRYIPNFCLNCPDT